MDEVERICRAHFNEPILYGFEVGRLIGYAEDEQDCYLIISRPQQPDLWHTAVGGYAVLTSLKAGNVVYSNNGEIWNDFTRLDNMLSLNGAPKKEEFIAIYHPTHSGV